MQNDRELRAALEAAQAALTATRRELERLRASQSERLEQLEERARISRRQLATLEAERAETMKTTRALDQARRERDALSHQLEQTRRRASAAEWEIVNLQVRGDETPHHADSGGPAWSGPGRWLLRAAGIFLIGAFLAWGENLCGLFLGGALLVGSFFD